MERRQVISFAKTMAAAALLALLFRFVDWRESFRTIMDIRLPYIAVLLLISFVMNGISCLKWQLFLTARGVKTSFLQLFRLYLVGYFFNNFMPGSVGGDVVRGMELGRETSSRSNSYGSVFLERLTGFIALIAAAIAAAAINPAVVRTRALWVVIGLLAIVLVGAIAFLASKRIQDLSLRMLDYVPWRSGVEKARRFLDVVFFFRDKRR
ncbi:MAG: lysylphosphatidylglycerol synthase transmembrane domain-containing protein, partial [bacterium]